NEFGLDRLPQPQGLQRLAAVDAGGHVMRVSDSHRPHRPVCKTCPPVHRGSRSGCRSNQDQPVARNITYRPGHYMTLLDEPLHRLDRRSKEHVDWRAVFDLPLERARRAEIEKDFDAWMRLLKQGL